MLQILLYAELAVVLVLFVENMLRFFTLAFTHDGAGYHSRPELYFKNTWRVTQSVVLIVRLPSLCQALPFERSHTFLIRRFVASVLIVCVSDV